MGHIARHSITLSAELSATVDEAVASGEYDSIDAVVRDALGRWKNERDLFGYTIEELRALAQEGIDSGPGRYRDMEAIKAEARLRFEKSNGAS